MSTTETRKFEGIRCDDGYEFIGAGAPAGWKPVPAWGTKGWDLGDWPLVVVLFRDRLRDGSAAADVLRIKDAPPGLREAAADSMGRSFYERAVYVEGDITVERFDSERERNDATDETALYYWRLSGAPWVEEEPGEALRGPYRRTEAV